MDLLEKLINLFGVSGNEEAVRGAIKEEIKKHVDEISVDKLGNLIAHKKGKHPRIMLAAHMDEIGLMVKRIKPDGRILVSIIGGIDPPTLMGERVHIETKKGVLHGLITTKEISDGYYVEKLPKVEDLFVDTGLSKNELEKMDVKAGTYLSLERDLYHLGSKDVICGKAFDNRIGCYILIELIKRLKKTSSDIYYVFTIEEEIGLFGAMTSAYMVQPDWAIAIDVAETLDASGEIVKTIGNGPCVVIKDAETIANKTLNKVLVDIAKKKRIPIQFDVSDVGTTDAASIQITRGGVPCTVICIPIRNLHTATGIAHKNDIENTIKLLEELLKNPPDSGLR